MAEPKYVIRDRILKNTKEIFGVTREELKSDSKVKTLVQARAAVATLLRGHTKAHPFGPISYPSIGKALQKDHTTVLSAEQVVRGAQKGTGVSKNYDPEFRRRFKIVARRSRPLPDVERIYGNLEPEHVDGEVQAH